MESVSASDAKQNFGELIASAQRSPVAIKRHGKVVAILSHPAQFLLEDPLVARRLARQAQKSLEQDRLMQHQRVAIRLLSGKPEEASELVGRAQAEVERWASDALCSIDYISRWRDILALPLSELVAAMCGDYQEWGTALRQNSPWRVALGSR